MDALDALLSQFLVPENVARKHAEEELKRLSKDPAIVVALLQQVRCSSHDSVRQLAAVLLRKKLAGHWAQLPGDVREQVKATLLESIARERSPLVRRASADAVGVIAKHTVPAGEWPGLLQFLFQCSQSPEEDHREVALVLFSSLTETIGDVLQPHFPALQQVLLAGLKDVRSHRVRIASLKAVGALVDWIGSEEEVVLFRALIGPILDVSRFCLKSGDEDVAIQAFEILEDFSESPAPLLGPSIRPIVQFALEVASHRGYDLATRNQASQLLAWLARFKPKLLLKHGLQAPIVERLCMLLAEGPVPGAEGPVPGTEVEDADMSADKFAAQVLDMLAIHLPSRHIYPAVLALSRRFAPSPHSHSRQAAVTALGVIAEGCSETMRRRLKECLPLVLGGLRDPERGVRGAAGFAMGQFSEHLQPEIVERYAEVLPAVFQVLEDGDASVQEKAYYALAAYCEHLGEEILPFLAPLMAKLMEAIQSPRRDLQETCVSAIGSAATAAGPAFRDYCPQILSLAKTLMQLTKDEDLRLRSRATELVGLIGVAVGREAVEAYLPSFMEDAFKGFSLDYSELREYSHGFYAQVAELLGGDFAPYLPHAVEAAFTSCRLDDGEVFVSDDEGAEEAGGAAGGGRGVLGALSSDEDAGGDQRRSVSVRTGVLDEKAAATMAIGLYAKHTRAAFMPYLDASLKILKAHATYFHEDVRSQAMVALSSLVSAVLAALQPPDPTTQVRGQSTVEAVLEILLHTLKDDDDKETVANGCIGVETILKEVKQAGGQAWLERFVPDISEAILALLQGESVCQLEVESDTEDDDPDADHDEVLIDAVADVLPALAHVMGPAYEPVFRKHWEAMAKYTRATRPHSDRTMVVATAAEVAKEIGTAIGPYVQSLLPLCLHELSCEESANRRNAAFCAGVLCEQAPQETQPSYLQLLASLHPLFSAEEDDGVRDNAAGAVARMVVAQPDNIPLSQVLPVLLTALPLKEDQEEAGPVYDCLCKLIAAGREEIVPFIPQVIAIFGAVVSDADVADDVKQGVSAAVAALYAHYRDQIQPLLVALPPDQAAALAQRMGPV